jgi:ammonium transporter, Amt family
MAFYFCGYGLSTQANGGLIGNGKFLTVGFDDKTYLDWFYKYSLCSASTTIVSGSLAERTYVDTYIVFAILMTTIIYPVSSSWVIGGGWLH